MDDKELSIFEDKDAVPELQEAPVEPPVEETPEPAPEPEPESVKGEEEAAPPAAEPEPEQTMVPVLAMLDEREKRQDMQRQYEAMQAERNRFQQQLRAMQEQQKRQPAPDWDEDPHGAAQYQQQSFDERIAQLSVTQSRFYAVEKFGEDEVEKALSFFDDKPGLQQQFMRHPMPVYAATQHYQQEMEAQKLRDPAYIEKLKADAAAEAVAEAQKKWEAAHAQPSTPQTPPASLSKAGASGNLDAVAVKTPTRLNGLFNG